MLGRRAVVLALVFLGASLFADAASRVRVVHRGRRTTVVVHKGFPIRRTFPHAVVVAPRVAVRVAPVRYLPAVVWAPVVVVAPAPAEMVWEDAEHLGGDDGWLDFTLNADARGRKLYLGVAGGTVQMSFAEVVFSNGDTQVVDFGDRARGEGLYALLDFADGRKVDHVRILARAKSDHVTVSLRLLK